MVVTKLYEGGRELGGGREGRREGGQFTGHSSLSVGGKTEVLTGTYEKNTRLREGEREGEGGEGRDTKCH